MHLLRTVLRVLLCTAAHNLLVCAKAGALEAVLGLELLHLLEDVVDEAEPSAAAATEGGLEAEELDAVLGTNLVHLGEARAEVLLGDVRHAGVHHVAHELLAAEQRVLLELAGADGELAAHGSRQGGGV